MTLHVFSARLRPGFNDPDALDVTRLGADRAHRERRSAEGEAFAPSWDLLGPAINVRKFAKKLVAEGRPELAEQVLASSWNTYTHGFMAEMRRSYRKHRDAWDALLRRERVVLLCFCAEADRCHRALLRARILPTLGAVDCGELERLPEAA